MKRCWLALVLALGVTKAAAAGEVPEASLGASVTTAEATPDAKPDESSAPQARPAVPPVGEPALLPPRRPSERLVLEPARLEDGKDLRLPPLVIAQDRNGKDRAVMWIGGLLVLAAAFLWNRSRRQELERRELAASTPAAAAGAVPSREAADAGPSREVAAAPTDPGRPSKEP